MQEKSDICLSCPHVRSADGEIACREIDEDHVVSDLPDILPRDKERVLPAETLENRLVPGRDDPKHSAVTGQSEIDDAAEPFAVGDVHDLLISQFAKSQFIHIK